MFIRQVAAKVARKLRAQRDGTQGVWFGLGMTGLIGWSVAVSTVLGRDAWPLVGPTSSQGHSWTLALLVTGLVIGCANAWHWALSIRGVSRERKWQPPGCDATGGKEH